HPNVVQILDFGVHEELAPFIVMELLEGESLADLLGRGAEMPLSFVFELIVRVLDALKAAHAAGVIHRDLKPENIFLTSERGGLLNPKLLDFGISKILDATGVARVTTTHGHIVGTPAYMSPEQARGLKEIDQRTDVYSMGVVLYELLSGDLPFYSENPGDLLVLIMTAHEQPLGQRVPQLAGPLSDLIERAMAKRPEQRYRDAGEMLEAVIAVSRTFQAPATVSHSARSARANGRTTAVSLALAPQASGLTPLTPVPEAGGSHARRLVIAALALLAAGLGAGAFALRERFSAAPPAQRFIVVQADPRVAVAQTEEPPREVVAPQAPASDPKPDPSAAKGQRT
ncbi:MAG TPA: serine/threonine-protein kinase, partial [Polyangiales bacterium]